MNHLTREVNISDIRKRSIKYTDHQIQFIISCIAIHIPPKQITEEFKKHYKKEINPRTIRYYRDNPTYKQLIEKERKKFENSLGDVELASKRMRIEHLQDIYYKLRDKDELVEAAKRIGDIRNECEVHKGAHFGNVYQQINYNQFDEMTDEELMQRLEENTKKLKKLEKSSGGELLETEDGVIIE